MKSKEEIKKEIEKEFKRVDETYTWNYKNFVIFVMPIINKAIEKALFDYNKEVIKMIEEWWIKIRKSNIKVDEQDEMNCMMVSEMKKIIGDLKLNGLRNEDLLIVITQLKILFEDLFGLIKVKAGANLPEK